MLMDSMYQAACSFLALLFSFKKKGKVTFANVVVMCAQSIYIQFNGLNVQLPHVTSRSPPIDKRREARMKYIHRICIFFAFAAAE